MSQRLATVGTPRSARQRGSGPGRPARATRARTTQTTRPIRVPELLLGVVLVVGCALAALVWHRSLTSGTTVVVAATGIDRGEVITADHLAPAEVRGLSGVSLVEGGRADELLGTVALVDIAAGEPVLESAVTVTEPLRADEGLASVAVERGQAPSSLGPGDTVRVVVVPIPDPTAMTEPTMLDLVAEVWHVEPATEFDAETVVTLRLPLDQAAAVTAADGVRLVRVDG